MLTRKSNIASLPGQSVPVPLAAARRLAPRMVPRAGITHSVRLQILLSQIMRKKLVRDLDRYFSPSPSFN